MPNNRDNSREFKPSRNPFKSVLLFSLETGVRSVYVWHFCRESANCPSNTQDCAVQRHSQSQCPAALGTKGSQASCKDGTAFKDTAELKDEAFQLSLRGQSKLQIATPGSNHHTFCWLSGGYPETQGRDLMHQKCLSKASFSCLLGSMRVIFGKQMVKGRKDNTVFPFQHHPNSKAQKIIAPWS